MAKKMDRKMVGILAIVFGVLVFVFPSILNYLVALFLIVFGVMKIME
jgi:uncharacterized membrane protein HdeD (DUF308 family)